MIDKINIEFTLQILLASCNTVYITICSVCVGMIIAIILLCGKNSSNFVINKMSKFFANFIISIPELVILLGFYFGSSYILTKLFGTYTEINNVLAGILTLAIIFGCYATEILQAGFNKINKEQLNAAKILGLSKFTIGYKIILPQLIKFSLFGLSNLSLILLKDTALLSLIGVNETLSKAKLAASTTYNPFLFYILAACVYLFFTALHEGFIKIINCKYKWGVK